MCCEYRRVHRTGLRLYRQISPQSSGSSVTGHSNHNELAAGNEPIGMQVAREKSRGPPLFVIKFLEFRFSVRFCDLFIALFFNAGYWRESDRERKRLEHRKGRVTRAVVVCSLLSNFQTGDLRNLCRFSKRFLWKNQ